MHLVLFKFPPRKGFSALFTRCYGDSSLGSQLPGSYERALLRWGSLPGCRVYRCSALADQRPRGLEHVPSRHSPHCVQAGSG